IPATMDSNSKFDQAQANYEFAINELMRPKEDVVLLSACHSVKKSIRGYLTGFLETNKVTFSPEESIESLMSRCLKEDANFVQFDMNTVKCKCDDGDCIGKSYCLSMEQVKNCISIVSDLGNFVAPGSDVAPI
ncbi:MAG: hypothetical protein NT084_12540, partial [Bacteroidetes bacterium]|nr:hypothetical protein [Bacteroidota bacterium]